jgi:hypothetical protein
VFVKWKERSYLHCSWVREADIEGVSKMFTHLRTKLRRFFVEQQEGASEGDLEEEEEGARLPRAGSAGPRGPQVVLACRPRGLETCAG